MAKSKRFDEDSLSYEGADVNYRGKWQRRNRKLRRRREQMQVHGKGNLMLQNLTRDESKDLLKPE